MEQSDTTNVTWHPAQVTRADRASCGTARGATVWLTGLSGSGKSTVAAAAEQRLVTLGRAAYRLDGDNMRTGLTSDLGFGRDARMENARRAAEVSVMFADAGMVALVALISPYAESRQFARRLHERAGLPFVEVYLAAPVDLCSSRDPKGLYARASAGEIDSFTGIDDPYEVPTSPDVAIEPGTPLADAVDRVLSALAGAEGAAAPG